MDKQDFLRLPIVNIGSIPMDIADFENQEDRTLFLANIMTETEMLQHHTYMKDRYFHVLITDAMTHEVKAYTKARELSAERLVPAQTLNPVVTDFEAAELLMHQGYPLEFIQDYDNIHDFYSRPICTFTHEDIDPELLSAVLTNRR